MELVQDQRRVGVNIGPLAPLPVVLIGGGVVFATVGDTSTSTVTAALIADSDGYLSDICSLSTVPNDCRMSGESSTPCGSLGLNSKWRFHYTGVSGRTTKYLAVVQDETCNVVETHDYGFVSGIGVAGTSAAGPSDNIASIAWDTTNHVVNIQRVIAPLALPGYAPAQSSEPNLVTTEATLDVGTNRVRHVDDTCGCGAKLDRTWAQGPSGGPPAFNDVLATDSAQMHTDYFRAPGVSGLDPNFLSMPVTVLESDSTGQAQARETNYRYLHPRLRTPTFIQQPGATFGTLRTVIYDYDDDDPSFPCEDGVTPTGGSVTLPNQHPTSFLCRVVDTDGFSARTTRFRYDTAGRLLLSEGPTGRVEYTYYCDANGSGSPACVVDADPLKQGMLYAVSRVKEQGTSPFKLSTKYLGYHFTGQPTKIQGPNGELANYTFDSFGRLTQVATDDNASNTAVTDLAWAADGKLDHIVKPQRGTDPRASIYFLYGDFGRLQEEQWHAGPDASSPVVQFRQFTYDGDGNVVVEGDFKVASQGAILERVIQRDYEQAHRLIAEANTAASGAPKKQFDYLDGRLHHLTDELGRVTTYEYDGFSQLRTVTGPELPTPAVTQYGYDDRGNLASVIDANRNSTSYLFDNFDELLEVDSPDTGRTTYSYNIAGQVVGTQDAQQAAGDISIVTRYDELLRPTKRTEHIAQVGQPIRDIDLVVWAYDDSVADVPATGRLSKVAVAGEETSFSYDAFGRILNQTLASPGLAQPVALRRQYFASGELRELDYPDYSAADTGPRVGYSYGADDRVAHVTKEQQPLADFEHHSFGMSWASLTRGNGLSNTWGVDLMGRRSILLGDALQFGSATSNTPGIVYNEVGNVAEVNELLPYSRSRGFQYDRDNRLAHAAYFTSPGTAATSFNETYVYDAVGNRKLKSENATTAPPKDFVSVFDLDPNSGLPTSNRLQAVVDPPGVDAGVDCNAPPFHHHGDDDEGEDEQHESHHEPGHRYHGHHGHPRSNDGGQGLPGHCTDGKGHDGEHNPHCQGEGAPDAGEHHGRCVKGGEVGNGVYAQHLWRKQVEQLETSLSGVTSLPAESARALVENLVASLGQLARANGLDPAGLQLALYSQSGPSGDFGTLLESFLATRQANGWALGAADVAQLQALLQLVAQAPVRLATLVDPSWDYTYDLAGRVVEERAQIPAVVAVVNGQEINEGPLEQTYCYRYDALGRMVGVEHLARYGAAVSPLPYVDPCDDPGRSQLAAYRYDVENKRDYAKVLGQESWQVRGPGGEVLAEVDSTGSLMRAFIYADGEPLALVQRAPGITTRPPTSGGCSSAPGGALAAALLLVLVAGRRRRGAYVLLVVVAVAVLPACGNNDSKQRIGVKRRANTATEEVLYFHNDALGTPRVLTNSAGVVVWRAEYRPFGELQVLEADADGDGTNVEQPLRFPGQYDDALGAFLLHQGTYENWNRHYDSFTGRYLHQPEMSNFPYGYANNNPTSYIDSNGRDAYSPSPPPEVPLPLEPPPTVIPPELPLLPLGPFGLGLGIGFCLGCPSCCFGSRHPAEPEPNMCPVVPQPKTPNPTSSPEAAKKWKCMASCNVQPIPNRAPASYPDRVTGEASASDQQTACSEAKRVATQSAPAGTYARHCQCTCSQ